MKDFKQGEFNQFLLENNIYGLFKDPITLKSGRKSHFYINFRNLAQDVWLADRLSDFIIAFINTHKIEVDTLYGVPEGATKIGILAQYKFAKSSSNYGKGGHVLAMGRAKPKEHGDPKDKFFVGAPRGKVVVIEDITTTGGSLLTTIDSLKNAGINTHAVISLGNRMEKRDDGKSVEEAITEKGVKFYSMSSALELLPQVIQKESPPDKIKKAIEEEFIKYGVKTINLD